MSYESCANILLCVSFAIVVSGMAAAYGLAAVQLTDLLAEYWNLLAGIVSRINPRAKVRIFLCLDELLEYVAARYPRIGSMLACPICLGWWLAAAPAVLCVWLMSLSCLWLIVIWPAAATLAVAIRNRINAM